MHVLHGGKEDNPNPIPPTPKDNLEESNSKIKTNVKKIFPEDEPKEPINKIDMNSIPKKGDMLLVEVAKTKAFATESTAITKDSVANKRVKLNKNKKLQN